MTNTHLSITFGNGRNISLDIDKDEVGTPELLTITHSLAKVTSHAISSLNFDIEKFIQSLRREHDRNIKTAEFAMKSHERRFPAIYNGTPSAESEGEKDEPKADEPKADEEKPKVSPLTVVPAPGRRPATPGTHTIIMNGESKK